MPGPRWQRTYADTYPGRRAKGTQRWADDVRVLGRYALARKKHEIAANKCANAELKRVLCWYLEVRVRSVVCSVKILANTHNFRCFESISKEENTS